MFGWGWSKNAACTKLLGEMLKFKQDMVQHIEKLSNFENLFEKKNKNSKLAASLIHWSYVPGS